CNPVPLFSDASLGTIESLAIVSSNLYLLVKDGSGGSTVRRVSASGGALSSWFAPAPDVTAILGDSSFIYGLILPKTGAIGTRLSRLSVLGNMFMPVAGASIVGYGFAIRSNTALIFV